MRAYRSVVTGVLLLFCASLLACQRGHAPLQPETPVVETYVPAEGSVGFDILPTGSSGDLRTWLATYTDEEGKTTRFGIELGAATGADSQSSQISSGQGKFLSEVGSDPIPLLTSLKKALQAKQMPAHVQKVDVLPFEFALLGENQTRSSNGSFSDKPRGDWTAMKIFLASGKAEVFLNFNPAIHKAEFSIKDQRYGDLVLAELARVF